MKELRYAALLHDFGKVGVREEVLVKAKKLPPRLWERVDARFDIIHRTIEREYLQRKLRALEQDERELHDADFEELDGEMRERLRRLGEWRETVHKANEPSILPEEGEAVLHIIAGQTFENIDGREEPYLHDDELAYLSIPKGSLNERERKEIESHVTQTFNFLTQIPWTEELGRVAHIAYGHHEKLDGRGYPRGVTGEEIPVQTRIMTIADIFDALTASDRPYKKAFGADRALEILELEAGDGMLDTDLVGLFIESKVYQEVLDRDWREL
jgi:response regulator RpfG family c-di-GMP phosphodiesterase